MRRQLGIIASIGVALAMVLAGCGGSSSGSGKGSPVTVTIWSWRSQDVPLWKNVQNYLDSHGNNITINFRPINPTSYDAVTQTAFDGGKGPDIFYDRAGEGTQQYAAAHLLQPLNGIVNFSQVKTDTLPDASYQGKTYGVPTSIETMSVFYNKAIFAKYHLSVPKTWAQLISDCNTLKSHGVTPIAVMGVQPWMLSLQFDTIAATMLGNNFTRQLVARKTTYDSPPVISALSDFQSLSKYFEPNFQAVGSADNEQEVDVALGRAAMTIDGIFDVPTLEQYNKNLKLGAFLIPPANSSQTARIDWYEDADISMNSHISDPNVRKAAEKIESFAATRRFGQWFSSIAGEVSAVKGVRIPSKYPLSIQSYKWFQTVPVSPTFGIRSPMDTPPPVPITKAKANKPSTTQGIFSAEQAAMLPLLEHKMTPSQAAAKIQSMVAWYFKR